MYQSINVSHNERTMADRPCHGGSILESRSMKTTFAAPTQRQAAKRQPKKTAARHTATSANQPVDRPWQEVRNKKVARAKKLLRDANYPSPEVVRSVAGLLARNWHKTKNS